MTPLAKRVRFWAVLACIAIIGASNASARAVPLVNNTALDATQAASQESNLGNLAADAIRDAGHTDVAFLPASELRAVAIPAGHIDSGQLTDALRAASDESDTVVVIQLTGAQIKKALAHGLSRLPAPYAGFLQVAGLRVVYRTDAHGVTITSVILSASGSSLVDDHTYTVGTSRLLADGALGYFEVWSKSDISRDTSVPLAKALADFATAHQPLDYQVEGRITAR